MTAENERKERGWKRWWLVPLALFVCVALAFGVDRARYSGKVQRGVTMAGVSLSGLDERGAREAIARLEEQLRAASLVVAVGDGVFPTEASDLGFELDVDATLRAAMAAGREGGFGGAIASWFAGFFGAIDVSPVATLDGAKAEALFARWENEAIDQPAFEGGVRVSDGEIRAELPRAGSAIDRQAAKNALIAALARPVRGTVKLPTAETRPVRTPELVEQAVLRARELTKQPLTLAIDRVELEPPLPTPPAKKPRRTKGKPAAEAEPELPERIAVTFERAALLSALRSRLIDTPAPALEVTFDAAALEKQLESVRPLVEAPPRDARFEIDDDDVPHVIPGRPARLLDLARLPEALIAAADSPAREAKIPIAEGEPPAVTTESLEQLGVTRLVSKFTTTHPCCAPRVKNIHRIADLIDGVLVKPGETFSVNAFVGPRTEENGFLPAPSIVAGEMEDTVGGGISQFATTLFNAAFHGGYDITERAPHSFYFRRYPVGHEATISYPKPDLAIRNDTEAGMLIRCSYTPTSITVKVFGENGGRKVRRKVSPVQDVVDPPIEYEADPTMDPEKEKTVERGEIGWTVMVARIIEYPDGTSKTEERKVVYRPRTKRVRVHPCKIPEGEKGHTGDPCPEPETEEGEDEDGAAHADDIERGEAHAEG